MNQRTGKECKKTNCKNYGAYSHWFEILMNGKLSEKNALKECMECKNAHVSQYQRKSEDKNE